MVHEEKDNGREKGDVLSVVSGMLSPAACRVDERPRRPAGFQDVTEAENAGNDQGGENQERKRASRAYRTNEWVRQERW